MDKQQRTSSRMSIITVMLSFILLFSTAATAQSWEDNYKPTYNQNVELTETNLPIVFIDLLNQTIPDKGDGAIAAHMKIIDNGEGNYNYRDTVAHPDQNVDYAGWIEIKYRGNTSFGASEKKPYAITTLESNLLPDDRGSKKKVKILGMGKDNKWAVIAPFADKVMFRDILSYELARPWMDFVPQAKLCEFIVDGTYYGVYAISERVSKGKDRLNLHDPGEDEGDLTGDYLVEIDRSNEPHYESKYHPWADFNGNELEHTINYQYKSPGEDDFASLPEGTREELHHQIDQMEDAFAAENYTELYPNYIDVTSFIDYMLSTEISMNVDGYRLSTSLYKYSETRAHNEGLDSRWKMAVWDYNIAWGNANYNDGNKTDEWQYTLNMRKPDEGGVPFYWYKMVKDPEYMKLVRQRWAEYREANYSDENIMATVDSLANLLTSCGAVDRNNEAWGTIGREVWPNAYLGWSYEEEINYLKGWIRERVKFMDKNLLPRETVETEPLEIDGWDADVIAENLPASEHTDCSIDASGYAFYSEALDEQGDDSGLPNNSIVISNETGAKYRLAPYHQYNSITLTRESEEEEGDFQMLVFNDVFRTTGIYMLGTSGDGESELLVTTCYMDGTEEQHTVKIPDWCASPWTMTARNGLGRIDLSTDDMSSSHDFALFDIYVPTIPDKDITTMILTQESVGTRSSILAFSKVVDKPKIELLDDDSEAETKNSDILTNYNKQKVQSVTLKNRTLYKDGSWNTLSLPFSLQSLEGTPLEGATIKTLTSTSFKNGTLTLNFSDNQTSVSAGVPYIVRWDSGENTADPVFTNVTIDNNLGKVDTEEVTFEGFYSPYTINDENRKVLYMGGDNKLYYPASAMTVGACRALIHLKGDIVAGDITSASNAKEIVMYFGDETTAINSAAIIDHNQPASGAWFTIDGQRLSGKPAKKGVYICNGKKFVVE